MTESKQTLVSELITSDEYKNCIRTLLKETLQDELKTLYAEIKSLNEKVDNITEEVEQLKGENLQLQSDCEALQKTNSDNEKRISSLQKTLNERSETIEDLQQYTRRNCLIVTGLPEEKGEDTDQTIRKLAKDKMNIDLDERDLDRSHRLGKPQDGKRRPIVVKFTRYNTRQRFMKNRKHLKGSRVGVQDLLTPHTQDLLKEAKKMMNDMQDLTAVWTWDGKVMVQVIWNDNKARKTTYMTFTTMVMVYPGPEIARPLPSHKYSGSKM